MDKHVAFNQLHRRCLYYWNIVYIFFDQTFETHIFSLIFTSCLFYCSLENKKVNINKYAKIKNITLQIAVTAPLWGTRPRVGLRLSIPKMISKNIQLHIKAIPYMNLNCLEITRYHILPLNILIKYKTSKKLTLIISNKL